MVYIYIYRLTQLVLYISFSFLLHVSAYFWPSSGICLYYTTVHIFTTIDIYMSTGYIVWRCSPSVRLWRQNSFGCFSRWRWNTLRNCMCGVACCRKAWGRSEIMIINDEAHGARVVGGGGVGKQWTEKESFQQYFYNRYKILHTCQTYCCYAFNFYAYWLYFIYVWHVYVSPKTYK
jgi:hypothetical protein